MSLSNIANLLVILIASVVILITGKGLIIPFFFALLLWFFIRKIRKFIDKIQWINKYIPQWIKNVLISFAILAGIGMISVVLSNNINDLSENYMNYSGNIDIILNRLNEFFNINIQEQFKTQLSTFNFSSLVQNLIQTFTDLLSNTFVIIIYVLFIFLEESSFNLKLKHIFKNKKSFIETRQLINEIEQSISNYIGLKTFTSLITGTLSFIVLLFIGIDAPVFWAFLIFLLNFIPTIGSLIATLFPTFFCLIQFGDFSMATVSIVVIGLIQVIVGNILEPKIMGESLNVSSLVTILALSFWGAIWGVTGMFLSIPITVIIIILLSHFKKTEAIAIMLSDKPKS